MKTLKPTHEVADAFWSKYKELEDKHGYYESTWGALRAALSVAEFQCDPDDDMREACDNNIPQEL